MCVVFRDPSSPVFLKGVGGGWVVYVVYLSLSIDLYFVPSKSFKRSRSLGKKGYTVGNFRVRIYMPQGGRMRRRGARWTWLWSYLNFVSILTQVRWIRKLWMSDCELYRQKLSREERGSPRACWPVLTKREAGPPGSDWADSEWITGKKYRPRMNERFFFCVVLWRKKKKGKTEHSSLPLRPSKGNLCGVVFPPPCCTCVAVVGGWENNRWPTNSLKYIYPI